MPTPTGTHVLHRRIDQRPPVAVRGAGIEIVDADGRRYIDASGGAAVSCLGHGHPAVSAAMKAQIDDIAYAHNGFFTTPAAEELAALIAADAPGDLDQVLFVQSGSEAVEAALKLARQYFLEIGQKQRTRLIARRQAYHGNTIGALSVGGHPARRRGYEPWLFDASHIAPCFAYRHKDPAETEEAYGRRVADELEHEVQRLGPETVAAFLAEPVVGATLGAVPAVQGYFTRIREICDRHGILLILDEVMCGMGRTGTMFACEQEGIAPDIAVMAKGLGAGYQPIGAVIASRRISDAIKRGSGSLQHGHTYMAHPVGCAAALAVQKVIREERLLDNVRRQSDHLRGALEERFGNHRHVGDIRGRGLLMALELVQDRATRAAFDPALTLHARVKAAAMERGLICYPSGGTIDGVRGDHVLLAPPYIVDKQAIVAIVERLGEAVDAAIASC
jgi:adenosylmethionine-8-amino-7-oxononanoate aminotransferase